MIIIDDHKRFRCAPFSDGIAAEEDDPPEVVEADETDVVHLAPRHQFALLGVDRLEEAVETLHAALRHQARVQLWQTEKRNVGTYN